jgi:ParB family chromosome partitioning protein
MIREQRLLYLNPRDLQPSRRNVRSDPGDLAGLAETIREHGVLQPLGVTREDGGYRIVYGNRRRDAAIVVGLDRVPCVEVGEVSDAQVLVQQVLENLQRLDLNDLDKARAFCAILERLVQEGASQGEALDALARTLGLSVRQIQRYTRLSQLAPEVQALLAEGELGVTHGQHLVGLEPPSRQAEVARLAVEEGLSAAELARLTAALAHNANIAPQAALEALRRGERVPVVETRLREGLPGHGTGPAQEAAVWDDEGDDSQWGEEADDDEGAGGEAPVRRGPAGLEPTTRDGNRVRRLHSMDSFMDEVERLSVCVQEGDLQRFLGDDEAARLKVRLAARQLRFLADTVSALADALDAAG